MGKAWEVLSHKYQLILVYWANIETKYASGMYSMHQMVFHIMSQTFLLLMFWSNLYSN